MPLKEVLLIALAASLAGVVFGYFLRWIVSLGKKGSVELEIKQLLLDAKEEAKKITEEASKKAEEALKQSHIEVKEKEEKLKKTEDRLIKKEELLDKRQIDIDKEVAEIKKIKEKVDAMEVERQTALLRVAGMTEGTAKEELLAAVEKKCEEDIMIRMQKLETMGQERLEKKAKDILATSIQRLSSSVAADALSTVVSIPSDDLKGKIIGKEGRNIKAFERATGIEVIVDDTPGSIIISSFDPVRRQVARVALENLILDGRIQPAKIEKEVEKA